MDKIGAGDGGGRGTKVCGRHKYVCIGSILQLDLRIFIILVITNPSNKILNLLLY